MSSFATYPQQAVSADRASWNPADCPVSQEGFFEALEAFQGQGTMSGHHHHPHHHSGFDSRSHHFSHQQQQCQQQAVCCGCGKFWFEHETLEVKLEAAAGAGHGSGRGGEEATTMTGFGGAFFPTESSDSGIFYDSEEYYSREDADYQCREEEEEERRWNSVLQNDASSQRLAKAPPPPPPTSPPAYHQHNKEKRQHRCPVTQESLRAMNQAFGIPLSSRCGCGKPWYEHEHQAVKLRRDSLAIQHHIGKLTQEVAPSAYCPKTQEDFRSAPSANSSNASFLAPTTVPCATCFQPWFHHEVLSLKLQREARAARTAVPIYRLSDGWPVLDNGIATDAIPYLSYNGKRQVTTSFKQDDEHRLRAVSYDCGPFSSFPPPSMVSETGGGRQAPPPRRLTQECLSEIFFTKMMLDLTLSKRFLLLALDPTSNQQQQQRPRRSTSPLPPPLPSSTSSPHLTTMFYWDDSQQLLVCEVVFDPSLTTSFFSHSASSASASPAGPPTTAHVEDVENSIREVMETAFRQGSSKCPKFRSRCWKAL